MSGRSDLAPRVPVAAVDAALWNAVLSRFETPRPVTEALSLRIRHSDRGWTSPDVDVMAVAGVELSYEWLTPPPDLPPGLQLTADRLAALPPSVRRLMSAMILMRASAFWSGPSPAHQGARPAAAGGEELRLVLEFFRDDAPFGVLLVGVAPSDAAALARAAGLDRIDAEGVDPRIAVDVLPRLASLSLPAAEVEALAPGDVVLLGPLTAPFDALRIGSKLHPVRRVEDGGFILDIAP